jgi:hypothetical protein
LQWINTVACDVRLVRGVRNPLTKAVAVLEAIESGRYDTPVPRGSADETGRVLNSLAGTGSVNDMDPPAARLTRPQRSARA